MVRYWGLAAIDEFSCMSVGAWPDCVLKSGLSHFYCEVGIVDAYYPHEKEGSGKKGVLHV